MRTGELLNHLATRATLLGIPPLPDETLQTLLKEAHRQFVVTSGGVPDKIEVDLSAGESDVVIPLYVQRIKSARREDGGYVEVVNRGDARTARFAGLFDKPGQVECLLIGSQVGVAEVARVPTADGVLILDVDRVNKTDLTWPDALVPDVADRWHMAIVDHALGQLTRFNTNSAVSRKAVELEQSFYRAVTESRAEQQRRRSKLVRVVQYGGI